MASDLEGLRQAEERAAQFVRDEMYFDDLDSNKNDALLYAYRDAVEARVRAEITATMERVAGNEQLMADALASLAEIEAGKPSVPWRDLRKELER